MQPPSSCLSDFWGFFYCHCILTVSLPSLFHFCPFYSLLSFSSTLLLSLSCTTAFISFYLIPGFIHNFTKNPTQNKTLHHMLTPLQQGTFISNNSCSLWILRPFQVWWEPTWTLRETRMARQPPNPLSSRSPPPQVTHPEELNIGEFRRVPSRSPHRVLRIRVSHFTSVAAAVLFVCLRLCQEDSRPPKLTHLLFLIISDFVHFCHIAFFPPVECLILF